MGPAAAHVILSGVNKNRASRILTKDMDEIEFKVDIEFGESGLDAAKRHDVCAATEIIRNQLADRSAIEHLLRDQLPISLDDEFRVENLRAHESSGDSIPFGTFYGAEPWLIVITVPFTALVTSFMTAAGSDAYTACRQFFAKLLQLKPEGSSLETEVQLTDPKLGPLLTIYTGLPQQAFRELASVVLPVFPAGSSHYRLYWAGSWRISGSSSWHLRFWIAYSENSGMAVEFEWDYRQRKWALIEVVSRP